MFLTHLIAKRTSQPIRLFYQYFLHHCVQYGPAGECALNAGGHNEHGLKDERPLITTPPCLCHIGLQCYHDIYRNSWKGVYSLHGTVPGRSLILFRICYHHHPTPFKIQKAKPKRSLNQITTERTRMVAPIDYLTC